MGSKLSDKEKEKMVLEFWDKLGEIGKIKNPLEAMRESLKVADWLGDLYEAGYKKGVIEGKANWAKDISKN